MTTTSKNTANSKPADAPGILDREIEKAASAINAAWNKSVAAIFETARLCADAEQGGKYGKKELTQLKSLLHFSPPTFSKLAKIGKDARLQTTSVQKLLPPQYSIIYEIAQLDDALLEQALNENRLHPKITRKEVIGWWVKPDKKPVKDETPPYAVVAAPDQVSKRKLSEINRLLDKLVALGCSVKQPWKIVETANKERWKKKFLTKLIGLANEVLKQTLTIGTEKIEIRSEKEVLAKTGWTKEEWYIDKSADELRIRERLENAGESEEFGKLRRLAEESVKDFTPLPLPGFPTVIEDNLSKTKLSLPRYSGKKFSTQWKSSARKKVKKPQQGDRRKPKASKRSAA